MSDIEGKIMEYGQNKEKENLHNYIENVNITELINVLTSRIYKLNGIDLWNYTLKAFTDNEKSHKMRFKVVSALLNELEKNELPTLNVDKLITILCPELFKFKTNHLIQLTSFCIEKIQNGLIMSTSWKDLLPKILGVLIDRQNVDYENEEITGSEYKSKIVESLCHMLWSPNIILSLAKMFLDMPLTKEEHLKVVNKLCHSMESLTCQEIPPLVYQLLQLCRHEHSNSIFLSLQHYFGTRIYNRANLFLDTNTDNSDLDTIESASELDILQMESTVLFHIQHTASVGHNSIKEYLNRLKMLLKSPEFVLHPFNITVLLTISSVHCYKETALEILKVSIANHFAEDYRRRESCWYRETVPNVVDIPSVFNKIIEFSINERPLVVEGLVHLAFTILGANPSLSKESVISVANQVELGNYILVKVVKRKRYLAGTVVEMLKDCMTRSNNGQYIDCLQILCHHLPLVLLENQSGVILLLKYILQLQTSMAIQLLEAVMPLIKMSSTVRDHLILLLRKALYTRITETRQMAVIGFLRLLKHMKVTNLAALSQSSSVSSAQSYLTQISMETRPNGPSAFSNEALCLEVLGILKCCFMQQAEVRAQLYEGLYDAVCTNPELGIPVLDILWNHLETFYIADEETLPPLNFSKISSICEGDVILEEPLSKLVYSIGMIVSKVRETDEENETVTRFFKILDSIVNRMSQCELIHFELDDGTNLLDNTPEAQTKLITLKEAIFIYEALIGFKICLWGSEAPNCGKDINDIFKTYTRLIGFSKNLTKPKKAEKETKRKQEKTQSSSVCDSSPVRTKTTAKPTVKTTTILNLQTLSKILDLLHKTRVEWTSASEASVVRIKSDFNRYIMECAIYQVERIVQKNITDTKEKKDNFTYLSQIAAVLYDRCINRLIEFIDFDCQTALMSVECFHQILSCITKLYKKQFRQFLSTVGGVDECRKLDEHLTPLIETYQKLLNVDLDEIGDSEAKKLPMLVVNTLILITSQVPEHTTNSPSSKVLSFLKDFAEENVVSNKNIANSILSLLFTLQLQCKTSIGFFENVANQIATQFGVIDGNIPEVTTELKIINEVVSQNILQLLCQSVKSMLDDVYCIILRLKSEHQTITYSGESNIETRRELLKRKELSLCCHFCRIITIVSIICNITVPIGNVSESVIKIVINVYNTLSSLTKYFTIRSSKNNLAYQHSRFEHLVKLGGKHLTKIVYDFIMYIEESQKNEEETQATCGTAKKKIDSHLAKTRVLRERGRIPKIIFEIEQFGKCVFQLSTKTKSDLTKLMAQGTVRDFRLNGVKNMLENEKGVDQSSDIDEGMDNSNEDIESNNKSSDGIVNESDNENSSEDNSRMLPPRKKSKIM